jgi:hypothetical protein
VITKGYLCDLKQARANRLKCAWLQFMPSLLSSVFNQPCCHQFSWPQGRSEGGHYQVCIRCGDQYVYDWETLARAEKITASGPSRTLAPQPTAQVARTQRFTVRKPIFYRQVNRSQYRLAILLNISASGLLLECHPSIPEGTSLEMILEMPQEITGQPYRRVLCRGKVARSAFAKSGAPLVGVAISDYCFLQQR